MGPNLTEDALQQAARCVSSVKDVCSQFDRQSHVPATTSRHSIRSNYHDVGRVVGCVLRHCLLQDQKDKRQHVSFPSFSDNPFQKITQRDMDRREDKRCCPSSQTDRITLSEEKSACDALAFEVLFLWYRCQFSTSLWWWW